MLNLADLRTPSIRNNGGLPTLKWMSETLLFPTFSNALINDPKSIIVPYELIAFSLILRILSRGFFTITAMKGEISNYPHTKPQRTQRLRGNFRIVILTASEILINKEIVEFINITLQRCYNNVHPVSYGEKIHLGKIYIHGRQGRMQKGVCNTPLLQPRVRHQNTIDVREKKN